jgi:hypothetical protein
MDQLAKPKARSALGWVGYSLVVVPGIALYVLEILQYNDWWGVWGVLAAVLFPPMALAFPFVYALVEEISWVYFGLLALMPLGIFILARNPDET